MPALQNLVTSVRRSVGLNHHLRRVRSLEGYGSLVSVGIAVNRCSLFLSGAGSRIRAAIDWGLGCSGLRLSSVVVDALAG